MGLWSLESWFESRPRSHSSDRSSREITYRLPGIAPRNRPPNDLPRQVADRGATKNILPITCLQRFVLQPTLDSSDELTTAVRRRDLVHRVPFFHDVP